MNEFLQGTVILLPILSLLLIASVKLFWVIRRRFSVSVNCWFCDKNDRIPFDYRNNFICSGCQQYNGFNKDGGYNREIPEMHHTKLNQVKNCVFSEENVYALKKSNGFCDACNRDQELKILQLAAFVPEDEDNFDEEVSKYSEALEKAYRLCGRCDRVLRRSLNQVKSHMVGSNMQKIYGKLQETGDSKTKKARVVILLGYSLFIVSLLSVWISFAESDTLKEQFFDGFGTVSNKILEIEWVLKPLSYILAVKSLITGYLTHILDNPILQGALIHMSMTLETFLTWIQNTIEFNSETQHDLKELTNVLAMLANVILIVLFEGQKQPFTLWLLLFIWSSKTLMHNHEYLTEMEYSENLHKFDLMLSALAVILSLRCLKYTKNTFRHSGNLNQSFHKISTEYFEESDDENVDLDSTSLYKSYEGTKSNQNLLNSTFNSEFGAAKNNSFYTDSRFGSNLNGVRPPSVVSSVYKSPSEINFLNVTHNKHVEDPVGQLTKLNLSTASHMNQSFVSAFGNPFYGHLNLDRQTPMSTYSIRSNSIVSPPKLNCNPITDPSWVGGGFWTTSPKKTAPIPLSTDFMPIISRTSSQSSGFESQCGNGGSRENSLAKENDKPATFLMSPSVIRPVKPHPVYPNKLSNGQPMSPFLKPSFIRSPPQQSVTPTSRTSLLSRQSDRSIFGEPGFADTSSLYSYQSRNKSINNQENSINFTTNNINSQSFGNRNLFNFKKFSNDLPNL